MPSLEVCLSPALFPLYDPRGKTVVVIDILRATSTITTALKNGADGVIPVASTEECIKYSGPNFIHAAERKGEKVAGFNHGNSPLEYRPSIVAGKTIVLTTTNGTLAFRASLPAAKIYCGSFLALSALCANLLSGAEDVLLFCAGWKNRVNMEDTLFAGAVTDQIQHSFSIEDDSALIALHLYQNVQHNLMESILLSSHYKRLVGLGIKDDIEYCLKVDLIDKVPEYEDGLITLPT